MVKNPPAYAEDKKRCGFYLWARKIPWRRKWQSPLQYSCLENPHGQWSLVVYSLNRVENSQTQLKQLRMHIQRLSTRFRTLGFLDGSGGKESACNTGDLGLIPGLGRSPTWINIMDRGAWQATVHGSQSQTQLSVFHFS